MLKSWKLMFIFTLNGLKQEFSVVYFLVAIRKKHCRKISDGAFKQILVIFEKRQLCKFPIFNLNLKEVYFLCRFHELNVLHLKQHLEVVIILLYIG